MTWQTTESRNAYKKQRNYWVSLLRKIKKNFYEHLNPSFIFWTQVKNSNIILSEGNEIISNPEICAEIFNNFFSDAVDDLDIDRTLDIDGMANSDDPCKRLLNLLKSSELS